MENFLTGKKHIHFIGIGGSGMYPLAQILHSQGYYLTGSDNNETATLDAVRKMGIPVHLGHSPENIKGADLIVHTAAIMADNPELIAAKNSGVLTVERSELLGLVTSWYSKAFCVSGTHGKTTTTSMLTHILLAAGIDLSAVIGGKLKAIGGSGRAGKSEYMVCEACEFVDTFLKLFPNISIVLNIDRDHLDYFKTMENLKHSFSKFCKKTTDMIIANGSDANTMEAVSASGTAARVITFGKTAECDFYPENIQHIADFRTEFDLMHHGEKLEHITTTIMHAMFNGISGLMLLFITFDDVGDYLMGTTDEKSPMVVCYLVFCFIVVMLMIVGVFMAIAKLRKIRRYKVPRVWDVSAGRRWGIFLSRFTVIIALVLAADTFTFQFIPQGIYRLLSSLVK